MGGQTPGQTIRRLALFCIVGAVALVTPFSCARALDKSLRITHFRSDTTIDADGSLQVVETLLVDFAEPHHGIFRQIPTSYRRGSFHRVTAAIKDISVTDEGGSPYQVSISGSNPRVIKIGDPDTLITGDHTYVIRYTVKNALLYFDDHDEWYWNITGTDWDIPIDAVEATVHLPFITDQALQVACFTGPLGSEESNCGIAIDRQTVSVGADDMLTVAIGWPKGLTPEPTTTQKIGAFFRDNWEYALPLLVIAGMWIHWYRHGRDPQGHPAFPVQYLPPKDLTPIEAGCLLNFRVSRRDIAAEIVSLACKGYLVIKEIETKRFFSKDTDYELSKARSWDEGSLKEHEKILLEGLFGSADTVRISALKSKLASDFEKISKKVSADLTARGYFDREPRKIASVYIGAGIILIVISFFIGFGPGIIIGLVSGLAVILFGSFMPRRTEAGVRELEYVKGLREYIERAEKYRLKFQETENTFFELMPYAMIFGVVEKWAEAFKDTTLHVPQWYQGAGPFVPSHFSHSMSGLASAASAATAPKGSSYSSGGSGFSGGFSGGGGGGGGGGGW